MIVSPSAYNPEDHPERVHLSSSKSLQLRRHVEECGFEFRKHLNNWTRNVLTRTRVEYFIGQVCCWYRSDWQSQGESCVAVKPSIGRL